MIVLSDGTVVDVQSILDADTVYPRVRQFAERYGSGHAALAMHAALPLGLTPELVHLLRVNFVPEAPFIAEADLLLSPLCLEVGGGRYVMAPDIREELLGELGQTVGRKGLLRRSMLLVLHAERVLASEIDPEARNFFEVQRLAGLAYTAPGEAARALATSLSTGVRAGRRGDALQVARLTRLLAMPLLAERPLLRYATGVERLARRDIGPLAAPEGSEADRVAVPREVVSGVELPAIASGAPPWTPSRSVPRAEPPSERPRPAQVSSAATSPRVSTYPGPLDFDDDAFESLRRDAAHAGLRVDAGRMSAALTDHLKFIERWAETISFLQLLRDRRRESAFVEPTIGRADARAGSADAQLSVTVEEIHASGESFAILGAAGAGKTTVLQAIAGRAISKLGDSMLGEEHTRIPLLVRLRDLQDGGSVVRTLLDTLSVHVVSSESVDEDVRSSRSARVLRQLLEQVHAIVLLDGLDELHPVARPRVEREIEELTSQGEGYCVVLTCRTADYRYLFRGIQTVVLQPFSFEQLSRFALRWLGSDGAPSFLDALAGSPFGGTTVMPLVLSHLCAVFERSGTLPQRPIYLYELLVSLLVEGWDRQRGVTRRSQFAEMGPRRRERALQMLAFELTVRGSHGAFDRKLLGAIYQRIAVEFGLPPDEAEDFLNEVTAHTGILVTSGAREYEFMHRSIQEYLAAMYAVRTPDPVRALVPGAPNEVALVVAVASLPEEMLERVLCRLLDVREADRAPFVRSLITRLDIERPELAPTSRLGWIIIGLQQLLRDASVPNQPSMMARLGSIPVQSAVALAAAQSEIGGSSESPLLVPNPNADLAECLRTWARTHAPQGFGLPSDLLLTEET